MNSFVTCPQCHQQVRNDGSLSGQVVSCPHCRSQFTMPFAIATVATGQSPFAPGRGGNTAASYSPAKKSSPLVWIIGGGLAVMMLPCFACGLLGMLSHKEEKVRPAPQKQTTTYETTEAEQAEIEAEADKRIEAMGLGPKVTYANFTRISNGMSKAEVCDILGFDYEIVAESGSGKYKTEMLAWKAELFANCNVMFQNDKVASKAQIGLK